ncbi:MAG: winged helix DNA-binding domain-containing protein, partial [Chitinophagaceae bacterium]|nr:winged helix DNA-binding domain-containing protein [Anaerolineae bacterium]
MNDLELVEQRLYHQQISQQAFTQPSDGVAWMGAMQAQDYAGAKHAIGLRLTNTTDADIEQALAEKTIVRTWPLRGTLHFVAAADIRWMLALMGSRLIAGNARRYNELELDEATLLRSNDVLLNALADGKQITRK